MTSSKRDLPKYCYARGERIWVRYRDETGKWVSKKTPYMLDQVEFARRFIAAILRGIEGKKERGSSNPRTVAEYVEKWFRERRDRGVASAETDHARLKKYALPHVGELVIETVRPRHIRDMVRALRTAKDEDGERLLAPRSQHHVFNTLYNVFENAIVDEIYFGENPVKVKAGELPKKVDADPEWRAQATYAVEEVERLLTDPIIPVERRVQYALKALAGLRHGEVAALCWRHLDFSMVPLGKMHVVQAWSSGRSVVKSTKSEETRTVPIHPALAKILKVWKDTHWARIHGRAPALDDLVVPTRTMRCVSAKDANEAHKRDLSALGLRVDAGKERDRGGHDLRSWYETRCIEDGADSLLLRRTTHAAPKSVSGGYERFSWATLCREIAKLRVDVPDDRVLLTATRSLQAERKADNRWRNSVTPLGLEPLLVRETNTQKTPTTRIGDETRTPANTRQHQRVMPSATVLTTAARMLENAIRDGDYPRALEVVEQIRELGARLPTPPRS